MNKFFLTLFISLSVITLSLAQKKFPTLKTNPKSYKSVKKPIKKISEDINFENLAGIPTAIRSIFNMEAGSTTYDLQSNAGMPSRIHNWGNGVVSATWTMSITGSEGTGFADRGTGYNKIDPATGGFGSMPTSRLEGTTRTGFPCYFVTESNEEWIFSHTGGLGAYKIHFAHKQATATTWIQGDVPITSPKGGLWVRACAGGTDGNTIHLVYCTSPIGATFGGELINGLDGTMRYCRSTNGGVSWDIIDKDFPELNSTDWLAVEGDNYQISAQGNTVAIGLFKQQNDCLLWKSTNNGTTFNTARIVNDFPLKKWDFDDGYTFDQISAQYDSTYYPDSLALFTTDETGSVLVDNQGLVHLVYASLFVKDQDTINDQSNNWFPNYDFGLIYWNDTMANNSGIFAANSPDINGDGIWGSMANTNSVLNIDGYGGEAFSTGPSLGIGDDGRLYLSFIANHELYFEQDGGWLHQPFVAATAFGNVTKWQTARPLYNNATHSNLALGAYEECYFAVMAKKVDTHIHVLYQQDFEPGLTLRTNAIDPKGENSIMYIAYPVDSLKVTSIKNIQRPAKIDFTLAPNPTTNLTRLNVDINTATNGTIEIYTPSGLQVIEKQVQFSQGSQFIEINTSGLSQGIYFVKLQTNNKIGLQKLSVY
jgi:Secretion system C-terminal sorting domain